LTQGERSKNIKALLKWMDKKKRVTTGQIVHQILAEITDMGATERTAKDYLESLGKRGFIVSKGAFFLVTPTGKDWLERHI
jgi:hypothetical protein